MKKILTVLVATLAPTTAMASDGNIFDGYGSIAAGYNSIDGGTWSSEWENGHGSHSSENGSIPFKSDGLDLEARASAAVPLGGEFAAQVDGVFSRTSLNRAGCEGCDNLVTNDSTVAVHVFKRKPGKWLVGVIGQRSTQSGIYSWGQTTYYAGGEAQIIMGRVSLHEQLAYGTVDFAPRVHTSGVNATMQLRYFPKDNLMFSLRTGFEQKSLRYGDTNSNCVGWCQRIAITSWQLGAKGEYRLPKSRMSLLADVDYSDLGAREHNFDVSGYSYRNRRDTYGVRAMVGIKLNFGAGTLFERERAGAALEPLTSMSLEQLYYVD